MRPKGFNHVEKWEETVMNNASWTLCVFSLMALLAGSVSAQENVLFQEWTAVSQTKVGKTVSCGFQATAMSDRLIILTSNMTLHIDASSGVFFVVMLKITASKVQKDVFDAVFRKFIQIPSYEAQQIYLRSVVSDVTKVHHLHIANAWIKTASKTSIGKVRQIDVTPDPYYLGGTQDPDFFTDAVKDAAQGGRVVGYQEKPGNFDRVFPASTPLPHTVVLEVFSCMGALFHDQLGMVE